ALFTAPLQWLSGNAVLVYNVAFIGAFVGGGAGMYLLARTLTGRRDAAFVGAVVFAFSPFRVAHLAHLQWLMTGWLPFGLWALHRYMSTGAVRFLLIAAIAYLLQSFTAMYFIYFGLLPLSVVAIAEAWRVRPRLARTAGHVALAGAVVVFALAPIVRVYAWVRADRGFTRTPIEIQAYSADVSEYFRGHHLVRLWRRAPHGTGEHELFPGGVALALSAVALATARGRSRWYVVLYAVITAVAFMLSLGPLPSAWVHQAPIPGPSRPTPHGGRWSSCPVHSTPPSPGSVTITDPPSTANPAQWDRQVTNHDPMHSPPGGIGPRPRTGTDGCCPRLSSRHGRPLRDRP